MTNQATVISTWFVADQSFEATYFPQLGAQSDSPEGHRIYWQCVICFFASSLRVNPSARHMFFTNVDLPRLDDINLATTFDEWGIEIVRLPVAHRLPAGAVSSWGNQFYVFDIIYYLAQHIDAERSIILDSDCIWIRSSASLDAAIDRHGMITFVEEGAYVDPAEPINGLSRLQMTEFLKRMGGQNMTEAIPYFGGEIFAATQEAVRDVALKAELLWSEVVSRTPDAPHEEAHFLSIIAAMRGDAPATANPYIRRMWTSFKHNTVRKSDLDLAIWHLPAEKRSGFVGLYRYLRRYVEAGMQPLEMSLGVALYSRMMGVPRRSLRKFFRDASAKLREHLS